MYTHTHTHCGQVLYGGTQYLWAATKLFVTPASQTARNVSKVSQKYAQNTHKNSKICTGPVHIPAALSVDCTHCWKYLDQITE